MIASILNFAHQPAVLVRPLRSREMGVESYQIANVQLAPAARRAGEHAWRSTCEPSSGKNRSLHTSTRCAP
ncbi:hypothetical protein XFF6166_840020 [Xanthomonas citri pv. fuscans]|nr:hypothetical protein XFF6166_840020 [Xanthomonas citri pv. fuscans]SON98361.1 hypothetical protein XFF7767_1030019 [Xanthomonas citri pv. fuscans]SOO02600.1 hypothetical protein XFF6960_630137 [Xanthomonas citri pv. fuscans]SOO09761.1 hypothetical protein XFF6970_440134 [Xanthomonas citri pv. fuscans]SOO12829.1 hypothetical protein XFF7766_1140020 [Xanthomonas citri pv. fuscans]